MSITFKRPQGYRSMSLRWRLKVLPPLAFEAISNPALLSRIWGDDVTFGKEVGSQGSIKMRDMGCDADWPIETVKFVAPTKILFSLAGNPWHHRPDIVGASIGFELDEELRMTLSGFDLAHMGDAPFVAASSWAWTKMAKIISHLGGNPESELFGTKSLCAWTTLEAEPDRVRQMLLRADEAVKWLADEVQLEPRLGGAFCLKWNRPWGTVQISGAISLFEADQILLFSKDNPFCESSPLSISFSLSQSGQTTKLTTCVDGVDAQPFNQFASLLLSEIVQVALTSLNLCIV